MQVKRVLFCWLALLILSGGVAQPAAAQIKPKFLTEYRLDRNTITLPFTYRNNQIIVRGQADDKKDLTFLFDTGASLSVMDKELNLKGEHIADAQFREAEGITKAQAIWLNDMILIGEEGGIHVHNVAVFLADLSQISRLLGMKIDGVIGSAFMAGFVTEIDYAKSVIKFHHSKTYTVAGRKPDNQRTFLFDLKLTNPLQPGGTVTVSGKLHDKYDYDFLLDTGFGGYASVAQSAAQEAGLFTPQTPRVPTTSFSVTRRFQSYKIRAAYLMLGNINLSGRVIQVDVRNNDAYGQFGIVGNRFLQNYRVILDHPRLKLWLERATEKEETDDAEKPSLGLSIRADGRSIKVERVTRNSPAQRGGVRPGDMIVSINGQETAALNAAQVANLLAIPKGETKLSLTRGIDPNFGTRGEPLTVTLTPSSPLDWKAD
jgi:predicted aspartyl protease